MKVKHALIGVAAMFVFAATSIHAQTLQFAAVGSSALYLEMGQAAASTLGCVWTTTSKTVIEAKDSRVGGGTLEGTTAWISWSPGAGTCATPGSGSVVYTYLNSDSVIGNRCFFASPRCTISVVGAAGTTGANALPGFSDTTLPTSVANALSGASINAAATDIRPEDAKFATLRALTPCGSAIAGSQYLGLGYQTGTTGVGTAIAGSSHQTAGNGGSFNVFDFNLLGTDPITHNALPGSFTVTPVGAVPVVVVVNPANTGGFGSLLVSNIDRATLAGYLDGTYGRTADAIAQAFSGSATNGSVVYLREPVSGTYNTMEYAIPNNVQNKTSQEIGPPAVAANTAGAPFPPFHCNGGVTGGTWDPTQNPLNEDNTSLRSATGFSGRFRAIGTGNELKAVQATTDSLGYAFWSAANFAGATASNSKYLTVDGIDPIQEVWSDGLVPTSGNQLLGNVSLSHVKDGSYPIWSILRLVTDTSGTGLTAARTLVADAVNFLSPSQPDFVPVTALTIVRSHFAPPGVSFPSGAGTNAPSNGTSTIAEAGGDVGGLVLTLQSDGDYNADNGVSTGYTGKRQ